MANSSYSIFCSTAAAAVPQIRTLLQNNSIPRMSQTTNRSNKSTAKASLKNRGPSEFFIR